ncbi:putative YigZ family protein [Ciceribacter lividus]|uniref:Putative YigZ family protein n=1 Tax=Ciceribacter lividus TaxID=1197950 RepID=A0A6I7HPA5_9HYPH|nr:YigZ family protein [Ciceribacter lividus]RCW25836.1 putative YigZ family protein [Ciceribacter lividus]
MYTLESTETFEQEIKKSRFQAVSGPVATEAAARDFIETCSEHSAGHNCWAWRIGSIYRFSDDGEPSGTAGRPILQAIDGQSLDHVAVVVSRWFGGILLGSGGLIRAYGGTAATCLRAAQKILVVPRVPAQVRVGFADLALVKARLLAVPNLRIEEETFTAEGAELALALPAHEIAEVSRLVADLTSGRSMLLTST